MRFRVSGISLVSLLFTLASSSLLAQDAEPAAAEEAPAAEQPAAGAGDPVRGEALAYTCLGCHGVPNYKNAFPVYSVPKLDGQNPEYIVTALQAYRSGERSHVTMHAQASTLSPQDMADIAAFFAGEPLKPSNQPEGTAPEAAATCVACHGTDGVGVAPIYPTLSGQHEDYLQKALQDYKKGGRKNPIMATFASQLSDADIRALARYYSVQVPALRTEARPATRFSAR